MEFVHISMNARPKSEMTIVTQIAGNLIVLQLNCHSVKYAWHLSIAIDIMKRNFGSRTEYKKQDLAETKQTTEIFNWKCKRRNFIG